jgi:hypothetical protein
MNWKQFFDPIVLRRAYSDPLALANLAVDCLPVAAVAFLGWGAAPLVALYWLENLVVGLFTAARMVASAFSHPVKAAMAVFTVPFFTFHYGMFCFVHGIFVQTFAQLHDNQPRDDFPSLLGLVGWAVNSGPDMIYFLGAIIAVSAAYFLRDFLLRGRYKTANPGEEMFSPYGRIVTLHIALLLGAGLTLSLGQPLWGVLLLIALRVIFGVFLSIQRFLKRQSELSPAPVPAP